MVRSRSQKKENLNGTSDTGNFFEPRDDRQVLGAGFFAGSTGGAAFCVGGLHPPMKFEAVDNMPILRSLQDPHVVGVH